MKLQLPLSIEGISHELKRELDIYNSKLNDLETKLESLFKTKLWKNKENDYENKKYKEK